MKWVPDSTGRFRLRPYYEPVELDSECEQLVSTFLATKYGTGRFPISTDDLCVLIERHTSDLDLYADLSGLGDDVEGVTEFFKDKKPAVRIASHLTLDVTKQARLRTTLAHEFGHVRLHTFMWDMSVPAQAAANTWDRISRERRRYERVRTRLSDGLSSLDRSGNDSVGVRRSQSARLWPGVGLPCRRSMIFDAPFSDWMEWQASYACGAILMPASAVRGLFNKGTVENVFFSVLPDGDAAERAVATVSQAFDVSADAAETRLWNLGILQRR